MPQNGGTPRATIIRDSHTNGPQRTLDPSLNPGARLTLGATRNTLPANPAWTPYSVDSGTKVPNAPSGVGDPAITTTGPVLPPIPGRAPDWKEIENYAIEQQAVQYELGTNHYGLEQYFLAIYRDMLHFEKIRGKRQRAEKSKRKDDEDSFIEDLLD
jgi:hypothetical protein